MSDLAMHGRRLTMIVFSHCVVIRCLALRLIDCDRRTDGQQMDGRTQQLPTDTLCNKHR